MWAIGARTIDRFPSAAKLYLVAFIGAALLFTAALSGFNWYGARQGWADFEEAHLLRMQLDKLEAAGRRLDIVLLGDSSLGNAVDPAAWRAASGREVLALPLAGTFGYEGTLNMLRRVLRQGRPNLVVVMQTIELPTRALAPEGALLTAQRPGDLEGVWPWHLVEHFMPISITGGILTRLAAGPEERPGSVQGYVAQNPKVDRARAVAEQRFLAPEDLKERTLAVLEEIGRTCAEAGLRCVYAHGPYLEPACSAAKGYLAALDRRIAEMGFELAPGTPLCLAPADAGDQPDHVAPAALARFSEAYRERVLTAASRPVAKNASMASRQGPSSSPRAASQPSSKQLPR